MRLVKPSFEILNQSKGLDGIYKQIEIAGRTCYKSEDKITEDSAKEFVERMIKSGHGAMLEHGTVYLKMELTVVDDTDNVYLGNWTADFYYKNKYSKVRYVKKILYVTTNLRVLVENDRMKDLEFYGSIPTEHHERRVSVKFICDRGVSHEFVRHRVFSFAQESTRYCNYSKDKFGNKLTYIIPCWLELEETNYNYHDNNPLNCVFNNSERVTIGEYPEQLWNHNAERDNLPFLLGCLQSELHYKELLEQGWTPQQARSVLPNSLKTELVMTGFESDWKHFFKLRCANNAHPQAKELAIPLEKEFNI